VEEEEEEEEEEEVPPDDDDAGTTLLYSVPNMACRCLSPLSIIRNRS